MEELAILVASAASVKVRHGGIAAAEPALTKRNCQDKVHNDTLSQVTADPLLDGLNSQQDPERPSFRCQSG